MRTIHKWAALAVLGPSLLLGACDNLPTGGDAGPSSVTILLKDAPGDFQKAVVTVSEIYLQGEGGRVHLSRTAHTTDLLTLANDVAKLVDDVEVPSGTYSELRFVISGGYIQVEGENGTSRVFASTGYDQVPAGTKIDGQLHMPSFAQSGLKVKLPGGGITLDGGQKVLVVDFDVSQSFGKEAGQSGRWVMSPVLEATELKFTGALQASFSLQAGVVLPVIDSVQTTLADFTATLKPIAGGDGVDLKLSDANGDGTFDAHFKYLTPGDFTLTLTAPQRVEMTTDRTLPLQVRVVSGGTARESVILTSAKTAAVQ